MQSLRTDDILILAPYHYSYSLLSTPRFPMDQNESAIVEVVDVGVSVSVGSEWAERQPRRRSAERKHGC